MSTMHQHCDHTCITYFAPLLALGATTLPGSLSRPACRVSLITCSLSIAQCHQCISIASMLALLTPRPFRALGASTLRGSLACPACRVSLLTLQCKVSTIHQHCEHALLTTVVTVVSPIGLPSRSALGLVVAGLCAFVLLFSGVLGLRRATMRPGFGSPLGPGASPCGTELFLPASLLMAQRYAVLGGLSRI
jgi:hypothetical protein